MAVENTELERRVLAHEEILQALMAQLAEGNPRFLDRLHARFASVRRGAHEHGYTETADYAETFLHEVMRLVRVHDARPSHQPASKVQRTSPAGKSADVDPPVVIRTSPVGGVWHVTRDHVFLGDYLAEAPARDAAETAAHDIQALGGRAELIFEARR
jgi:hypothetical protein